MQTTKKTWLVRTGLALVWAVVLALPLTAFAQEGQKYRDQITQHGKRIVELRGSDSNNTMSKELTQVQAWLDDALVQVGKEEFKAVNALLRRAEVQLDFVDAQLALQSAVAKAEAREAELADARTRLRELKTSLEELQTKEKGMQDQLKQAAPGTK